MLVIHRARKNTWDLKEWSEKRGHARFATVRRGKGGKLTLRPHKLAAMRGDYLTSALEALRSGELG